MGTGTLRQYHPPSELSARQRAARERRDAALVEARRAHEQAVAEIHERYAVELRGDDPDAKHIASPPADADADSAPAPTPEKPPAKKPR